MAYCCLCGEKIKNGDRFYIYEGEIYCNECMQSTEITYYSTDDFSEEYIHENNVSVCKNLDEEIERVKDYIKDEKKWIEIIKNSNFLNGSNKAFEIRTRAGRIEKMEKLLKELENDKK